MGRKPRLSPGSPFPRSVRRFGNSVQTCALDRGCTSRVGRCYDSTVESLSSSQESVWRTRNRPSAATEVAEKVGMLSFREAAGVPRFDFSPRSSEGAGRQGGAPAKAMAAAMRTAKATEISNSKFLIDATATADSNVNRSPLNGIRDDSGGRFFRKLKSRADFAAREGIAALRLPWGQEVML
jgi:hypothetical protein